MLNSTDKSVYLLKNIVLNYKVNITDEEILILYNSNDSKNIRDVINYILEKYNNNLNEILISEEYEKLKYIFKKTRIAEFPTLDIYIVISIDLAKKFKLKVFNTFKDSHLFNDSASLINMIAIFGLFETDGNAEKRVQTAINLFFRQKTFSKRNEMATKLYVDNINYTSFVLNEDIKHLIPEELRVYLFPEITKEYYSFLRHMTGNYGRKINDLLMPYKKEDDFLLLKEGSYKYARLLFPLSIENIRKINITDYKKLLENKKWYDLCTPYKKTVEQYYALKRGLTVDECKKALLEFKEYELTYGPSDIQSMFRNANPIYDPDFYEFIIKHQSDISVSTNNFSKFSDIQKNYQKLKKYYASRGNSDPDFITMIECLRSVPYNVEFGDEEFAVEAKNAGVLSEGYMYYTNLLKKVRNRYKRAVPNHNKFYEFIDKNGKKYKIQTQILNGTDPLNLLIGESKYTDCCQKYNDLGQVCLEHAATSDLGGVFVVNLIENDYKKILCQSWVWVNEQEFVLDNIEQTNILNSAPDQQREIYEDLIAFAIKQSSNDILIESNNILLDYVEKEIKKLDEIQDLDLKNERRKRILEILKRQSLKVITVGANYSDIIVADYFDEKAQRKLYLPKDYAQDGYTDAINRYVAAGSELAITIEPSEEFIEECLYRDERQVEIKQVSDINNELLKKIMNIENSISVFKVKFNNIEEFINYYEITRDNISIIYGEDWYCLFNNHNLQIIKVCIGQPRLIDEEDIQKSEVEDIIMKLNIKDEKSLIRRKKLEVKL